MFAPPAMTSLAHTQAYARFFAAMTPETLCSVKNFLGDDVVFTDPFNTLHGPDAFVAIFRHMYAVMKNPRFEILDVAVSENAGYIKWRMTGALQSRPSFKVDLTGVSEVHFDAAGLVIRHFDHWDSAHQLLAKLPAIGWLVRRLLQLFALPCCKLTMSGKK